MSLSDYASNILNTIGAYFDNVYVIIFFYDPCLQTVMFTRYNSTFLPEWECRNDVITTYHCLELITLEDRPKSS